MSQEWELVLGHWNKVNQLVRLAWYSATENVHELVYGKGNILILDTNIKGHQLMHVAKICEAHF